ncbi:MerR family transcriptional regulator [Acetobacterium carbinolicum]|jgi:DNA-binding transcriptional MerR regulator/effector-binding domain-containing protein|uniref:MerR family transcriptional regulator n=1 Tax=Acetobacterium TaxID=33951 RepID=UPI000DBEC166|nr:MULTISPECIES: MerR family transcriptional regulator [unclassified Acetobacterium]AWW27452.1 MerR family transcriptional regulator [Acetobacterium sp. KB-1]MDK2942081.1 hypothetical protein [Acetobacterium sp.]MDZ5726108.1 MerR family transcriptional regulator [Acetobacterium sp. K1/6]
MNETYQCERKENTIYYKIGLFSKMNRVTIKALRHYDEIGLLKPAAIEKFTGYRYYTSEQLPLLHQILALREMGFTLDEIKKVQGGTPEKDLLTQKRLELLKRIAQDTLRLSQVESYLVKNDGESAGYHVILKELPQVIVASLRTTIPNYDALFSVVPPMGAEMERLGCVCAVPEYCFNIYHDGEYRETDVDVEICEAVTAVKEDSEMLKFKVIDRVKNAACVLHKGPYEGFPNAYNAILKWLERNGYEIIDHPRESYIDGAWNKDSAADWLTEIQFPVKKIN